MKWDRKGDSSLFLCFFVIKDGLDGFSAYFPLVARHSIVFKSEKEVKVLKREGEDTVEWSSSDIDDTISSRSKRPLKTLCKFQYTYKQKAK